MSRQQIQQFTVQQINQTNFTTITPLQITYFSGSQMAFLSSNQVQSLSVAQIQALNTGVTYPLLPLTNMTTLQLFDVATTPNAYDHIWFMSKAGLLTYFSVEQLRAITSIQFQSIYPSQFASFTALQMNAFQPLCYVNMSQNQLSNCGANLGGLLATSTIGNGIPNLMSGQTTAGSLLCYINPDCFRTMTGTHISQYLKRTNSINYINTGIEENLTPSAVQQLTGPQLSAFGCDVCGNIFNGGPDQGMYAIQALPCYNLGYITSFSTQRTISIYDTNKNIITNPIKTVFQDLVARYLLCPNFVSIPQISFLTGNQLRVFTMYQLQIITTSPSIYNNIQYNDSQIPYLSVDFIKYMPATPNLAISLTNYYQPSSVGQTYVTNGSVIYTANITALLPAQIALLNMQQVQIFNQSQIQALSQNQLQSLNVAYLTAIQLTYFTNLQFSYFTAKQIGSLTALQLSLITNQLVIQQILPYIVIDSGNSLYPLTPAQIGYLGQNTSQILLAHFPFFSQAQIQGLQVQYLTNAQFSVINISQLSPAQISQLSIQQLQLLSLQSLLPAQISALTVTQLQSLTVMQLQSLMTSQIQTLNIQLLTTTQLQSLNIQLLTTTQLQSLTLQLLTTTQLQSLLPMQISALTTSQIQSLTTSQLQLLKTSQIQSLNIQLLTTSQIQTLNIETLTKSQIQSLNIETLTTNQIQTLNIQLLTTSQIQSLNIQLLTTSQIQSLNIETLTKSQIQSLNIQLLTTNQIQTLNIQSLTTSQIQSLTTSQIQSLTTSQIQSLNIQLLTTSQIQSLNIETLTTNQIQTLNIQSLLTSQIQMLTTSQIQSLTPAQLLATQINQMTQAQLAFLIISNIPSSIISGITPSQLPFLSLSQLSASQLNQLTPAQWLTINLQQLSVLSIQGMSPQAFSAIPTSIFASLPVAVFGANFPASLVQAITSNNGTVYGQAYFMTSQQVSAISVTNLGLLSVVQISSFTPSVQAFIQSILNNKTPSCLSINIASFNSSVNSPCMNLANPHEMNQMNYNAIVSVTFPIKQAMAMFQYQNENNGAVRIYIDSSKLSTLYSYGSCNSVYLNSALPDFTNTFSLQERPYIADNNKTIPVSYSGLNATPTQLSMIGPNNGLQWIGPVTSSSIPSETTIPISWDYILNISRNIFNTWTSYTFFTNLYSGEKLLRQTINAQINAQINSTLLPFDMNTSPTKLSNTMLIDNMNKAYSFVSNNSLNNSNVGILIYNHIFSQQPVRFSNIVGSLLSFPFFSGDSLNFTLTILPHASQYNIVNWGVTIPPRVYLIKMIIQ